MQSPPPIVFIRFYKWENAIPQDLIYIGDNPKKDFVNLKKDGFRTVRVMTGEHKDIEVPA
jgi:putative hydrolase of the HAD superfamily